MMSSFHCHQAWGFSLCAPGGGQLQSQHLGTQVKTPLWLFSMSAIRELGVTHVLATTACGSLRESITPGLFLLPSSFIGQDTEGRSTCSRAKLSQTGPLGGHSLSIPVMGFQGCVTYPWSQVGHESSVILSRLWTCGALMNHLIQPSVQA